MVHGGRALARDDRGRVVLIDGALPGEVVEVDVTTRSGVQLGTVRHVIEAHPERVPAPEHPGLDLGFAAYPLQLRIKEEVLRDAARRAGVDLPERDLSVRPSPRVWGYRSAVQPAVRGGRLGYRRAGSDDVVPLDSDPTAMPSVDDAWRVLAKAGLPAGVREVALRGNDRGEALAALVADVPARELLDLGHRLVGAGLAGVALAPWDPRGRFRAGKRRLAGARTIPQRYGRYTFSVSATTFAQPNPEAAGGLATDAAALVPGGARACDLFAGGGLLAFHLADRYRDVVAIEIARESVERGRQDAERTGLEHVRFERADARRFELPDAELIAVDPPRSGLAKPLRTAIDASAAVHLLYVSCDVATWARDVADFAGRGWRLEEVRPFDLQPHTHHLELASLLARPGGRVS
jgi:tRNA/tmRNA/rRNA uracil-C5-methylase (TrmA/RlmC/RlmD family)